MLRDSATLHLPQRGPLLPGMHTHCLEVELYNAPFSQTVNLEGEKTITVSLHAVRTSVSDCWKLTTSWSTEASTTVTL